MYIEDVKLQLEEEQQILGDFFKFKNSLVECLKSNISKKCFKVDSSLTQKFKTEVEKILPEYKTLKNLRYCRLTLQHGSVYLYMDYCFNDKTDKNGYSSCHYRKLDIYVGKTSKDYSTFEEVNEDYSRYEETLKYSFEDIKQKLQHVATLLKECEEIQKTLPYYAKFQLPYVNKIN